MSAFIYLDVNTLRLLSYILFVLTLAHFRPPSTYIYREQPKSKSDSTKNFASAPKQLTQDIRPKAMPGRGRSHIPAHTLRLGQWNYILASLICINQVLHILMVLFVAKIDHYQI